MLHRCHHHKNHVIGRVWARFAPAWKLTWNMKGTQTQTQKRTRTQARPETDLSLDPYLDTDLCPDIKTVAKSSLYPDPDPDSNQRAKFRPKSKQKFVRPSFPLLHLTRSFQTRQNARVLRQWYGAVSACGMYRFCETLYKCMRTLAFANFSHSQIYFIAFNNCLPLWVSKQRFLRSRRVAH